jgi:hypothetical protein
VLEAGCLEDASRGLEEATRSTREGWLGELEVDVRIRGKNVEMSGFYRCQSPGAGNEAAMRRKNGTVTGRMESMMAVILSKPTYCSHLRCKQWLRSRCFDRAESERLYSRCTCFPTSDGRQTTGGEQWTGRYTSVHNSTEQAFAGLRTRMHI